MKFNEFKFKKEILGLIEKAGFEEPTSIQEQAIPQILEGKDIVGQSKTGSGKTAAFVLPVLDMIERQGRIQCLVLTPTRELCYQVADVCDSFGQPLGLKTVSIFGGVSINPQISALRSAHVVVGTPGRILDHMSQGTIDLRHVRFFVLDEVDRMADMGFIDDVKQIISQLPDQRQTMLFSATMTQDVDYLMSTYMREPVKLIAEIHVDRSLLNQVYYDVDKGEKFSLLVHLIKQHSHGLSLVFCGTRNEVDIVTKNLKRHNIHAMAIHGGMSQNQRMRSLDELKAEKIDVLVATDVAARGLDIKSVNYVYNYDVPKTSQEYTHRIGRTARAGASGKAFTLLTQRDHENFGRVLEDRTLKIESQDIPQFERVAFKRQSDDYDDRGDRGDRRGGRGYGRSDGPSRSGSRGFGSNRGGSSGGFGGSRGGFGRDGNRGSDGESGSFRSTRSEVGFNSDRPRRGGFGGSRPRRDSGNRGDDRREFRGSKAMYHGHLDN